MVISDNLRSGLQSKRPQVKTSPSQNVPELVKTSPKIGQNVPMVKNVGQNVPKMIFLFYILCNFRHNLDFFNETVLDIEFLSRVHSVKVVKILIKNAVTDSPFIHDPSNITLLYIH